MREWAAIAVLPSSAILFSSGVAPAQRPASPAVSPPFTALLRQHSAATDHELKVYAETGEYVKILADARKGEIAVAGAVRIPVTANFFLDQFRDIENFKKEPAVLGIGKFSNPPQEGNLAKLTLEKKDLNAFLACRPGKCAVKLSAGMIKRLRRDAPTAGAGPKLESIFRAGLWEYASAYMTSDSPAMITYSDTDPPAVAADEFRDLLEQFSWLEKDAPALVEALRKSPRTAHPQLDHFFYWSTESFGLKPVVSITEVLVFQTIKEGKPWAFIASKQIYADHYFEGSLGLTVVAEESTDAAHPMVSMAYFNRSMTDGLRGWLASVERTIIERRVRAGMTKNLADLRDKLAQAYADRGH